MICTLRRSYEPNALVAAHPPKLRHLLKQVVFELACGPGAAHGGEIVVTRWAAAVLPETVALTLTEQVLEPGVFDYKGSSEGVWHVNFADPALFASYGSRLLAQDELQVLEHPLLGAVREALIAEGDPATTEDGLEPTPVLVQGVERRCAFETGPSAEAPDGLYGNRFGQASPETVRGATRVLAPPTRTNLIAIAAPVGGGRYTRAQIEGVLVTAYTGFAAAVGESRAAWPDAPVEIRTGFWGCGAFGGNRHAMTLLQLLAARLSGVDRLVFYAFNDAGAAAYRTGARQLHEVLMAGAPGEPLAAVVDRVDDLAYEWGVSDGT